MVAGVPLLQFAAPSTGFDASVRATTTTLTCTSASIEAVHDAFQTLCETNTAHFDKLYAALSAAAGVAADDTSQCSASSKRFSAEIEPVTIFHSKTLAKLTLYELGKIMMRSVGCVEELLAVTIVLCARYCLTANVSPSRHLMHRLYVACLQLAMKAHSDHYYRNSHFAYLAGISAGELNRQEAELLRGMNWSVQVTGHQLEGVLVSAVEAAELHRFAKPAEPFGSRADRSFLALSSNGLSQSNMDLAGLAAVSRPTLAETCPVKIGAVLRDAQRPLGSEEPHHPHIAAVANRAQFAHEQTLQALHDEQMKVDSPRSAAGSDDEDDE